MRQHSFMVPSRLTQTAVSSSALRLSAIALLFAAAPALAQIAPDAGRTLQDLKPPPAPPQRAPEMTADEPASAPAQPGGSRTLINAIAFSGNTQMSDAQLLAALGEYAGKSYDLADMRKLANRVTLQYRAAGYPFSRAYIPPQPITDGRLRIDIIEGRYGNVSATGDPALAASVQGYLSALKPRALIGSALLERTVLLIDDLPGVDVTPVVRPGQEVGSADLDVRLRREPGLSAEFGIDNHGNRYTGEVRIKAGLQYDGAWTIGDQILARAAYSEAGMWQGSVGYSLPVGFSGLRGRIGYARTYYELAKEFASLDANGMAEVLDAGIAYPLIRSKAANLNITATYQHKRLKDRQAAVGASNDKSSDSFPVSLAFDWHDHFGGAGVAYGTLTYTPGYLSLDNGLGAVDRASGFNTRGHFGKWNLELARLQSLPAGFSLYGRLSMQHAGKNLDSSEGISLGGAYAVRAYPAGEGSGDEGWLTQLELRYALADFSPFVFHDAGSVKLNASPDSIMPVISANRRSVAGSGIGLRYQGARWDVDMTLAWRCRGGKPQSDTSDRDPRAWVGATYRFH